ncbi:MAG TPA: hypothetical protein VIB38_05780 [Aestuariivirgaceae bacterium]
MPNRARYGFETVQSVVDCFVLGMRISQNQLVADLRKITTLSEP